MSKVHWPLPIFFALTDCTEEARRELDLSETFQRLIGRLGALTPPGQIEDWIRKVGKSVAEEVKPPIRLKEPSSTEADPPLVSSTESLLKEQRPLDVSVASQDGDIVMTIGILLHEDEILS